MTRSQTRGPRYEYAPRISDNDAPRRNEISADIDPANILPGPMTRRGRNNNALLTIEFLYEQPQQFSEMALASFEYAAAVVPIPLERRHQSLLPKPPNHWSGMLRHPLNEKFKKAAKFKK